MSRAIKKQGGEIMNPYTLYEMALGSGLTEAQAKREMQLYCVEVGLDPLWLLFFAHSTVGLYWKISY